MTEIDQEAVRKLLELELPGNDSGASVVGDYLAALLRIAWEAGWQYDLYKPMLGAGLAGGLTEAEAERLDDGYGIPGAKRTALDALILAAIDAMGAEDETPGYWYVRAALAAAVGALQHVKLGTDDKLAAMARETLAMVDEAMQQKPADHLAAPELAACEAEIASLTDQRNRVSDTADRLRAQLRAVRAVAEPYAGEVKVGASSTTVLAQAVLDQLGEDDQ